MSATQKHVENLIDELERENRKLLVALKRRRLQLRALRKLLKQRPAQTTSELIEALIGKPRTK